MHVCVVCVHVHEYVCVYVYVCVDVCVRTCVGVYISVVLINRITIRNSRLLGNCDNRYR